MEMFNIKINLVNIYTSNIDHPNFYRKVENMLLQSIMFTIISGDINVVLDPSQYRDI